MSWDGHYLHCDLCNSPWGDVFIIDPGGPDERTASLCPEHEVNRG